MARTKKEELATENVTGTEEDFDGTMAAEPVVASEEDKEEDFEIPDDGEPSEEASEGAEDGETAPEEADAGAAQPDGKPKEKDRIQVASKRQKRKIYKSEAVFTEDGLVKTTKQNNQRHIEYIELAASIKEQNVLRGKLIGITNVLRDGSKTPIPFGEVAYKDHWTVFIPASALFDATIQPPEVIDALKDPERSNGAYKNVMNRRINSQVDFIATYADEKNGYAIGSHIWAMSRRSANYYSERRRDGRPDITSGMVVRGSVVQTNSYGIYVDLFGAETFIPNTELSWHQIADARDLYDVGSEVDVRILSIKQTMLYDAVRRKDYRVAKVSASVKQLTEDPNKVYFHDIEIGDSGLGVVTQVTEFGIFAIFKNKVQVKCGLYNGGKGTQPMVGDELRVEITKKGIDKENGRCTYNGTVKHWIRRA